MSEKKKRVRKEKVEGAAVSVREQRAMKRAARLIKATAENGGVPPPKRVASPAQKAALAKGQAMMREARVAFNAGEYPTMAKAMAAQKGRA